MVNILFLNILSPKHTILEQNLVLLLFFVKEKKFTLGYSQNLTKHLSMDFSASTAKQQSLFDYNFKDYDSDEVFKNNSTKLELRYAPNERQISTKMGKYYDKRDFPIYHLAAEKSWNLLNGNQDFFRLNITADWKFNIINYPTFFTLRAGKIFGEAPLWQSFEGGGKNDFKKDFLSRFILGSSQVFETMLPAEFISNQYIYAFYRQTIFQPQNNKPYNIQLLYRIGLGNMSDKNIHHNFQFKEMNQPYQEVGIEFNKFLIRYLGIGFYYRMGHYRTGNFGDDFAVKGTFYF